MIFAAGFGTRMRPLSDTTPKALLPVHNQPLISHIISLLPPVSELVVNTHHLAEQINTYFNADSFPFKISLINEPEILGTGGGLQNARNTLNGYNFLLWNCDILCNADFGNFIPTALNKDTDVLLFCNKRIESSYLVFDGNNHLRGIQKSNPNEQIQNDTAHSKTRAFCGISYFTKSGSRFFFNKGYRHSSIVDSWLEMAEQGRNIQLCDISSAKWIDFGNLRNYNRHKNANFFQI